MSLLCYHLAIQSRYLLLLDLEKELFLYIAQEKANRKKVSIYSKGNKFVNNFIIVIVLFKVTNLTRRFHPQVIYIHLLCF